MHSLAALIVVLGLNIFYSEEKDWALHTTRQCPLQNRVITAQCEGMGEVGSARYEPALLPPCPSIRALRYSNCRTCNSNNSNSRTWDQYINCLCSSLFGSQRMVTLKICGNSNSFFEFLECSVAQTSISGTCRA